MQRSGYTTTFALLFLCLSATYALGQAKTHDGFYCGSQRVWRRQCGRSVDLPDFPFTIEALAAQQCFNRHMVIENLGLFFEVSGTTMITLNFHRRHQYRLAKMLRQALVVPVLA